MSAQELRDALHAEFQAAGGTGVVTSVPSPSEGVSFVVMAYAVPEEMQETLAAVMASKADEMLEDAAIAAGVTADRRAAS